MNKDVSYLEPEDSAPLPEPRSDLLWVYIDLDKTLAEGVWTPERPTRAIGAPIQANVSKAVEVAKHGYKIVIFTSRPWTDYEAIEAWLEWNLIPWHHIQCGKPLGVLYVDDRGRHESSESWLPEYAQVTPEMKALIEREQSLLELVSIYQRRLADSDLSMAEVLGQSAAQRFRQLREELGLNHE